MTKKIIKDLTKCNKKRNIMDFAGIFKKDEKEWAEIELQIYKDREKSKLKT